MNSGHNESGTRVVRWGAALTFGLLLSTLSCYRGVEDQVNQVQLREAVKVVPDEAIASVRSVNPAWTLEVEAQSDWWNNVQEGDVLVFSTSPVSPEGALRRVTSVASASTTTTLDTEQASLEQVIAEGKLELHIPMRDDGQASASSPSFRALGCHSFSFNDEVLYAAGSGQILATGNLQICPDLSLDQEFTFFGGLTYLRFGGSAEISGELELTATGTVDFLDVSTEIASKQLPTIVIPAGNLPVVVTPVIEVEAAAAGSATAQARFGAQTSGDVYGYAERVSDGWGDSFNDNWSVDKGQTMSFQVVETSVGGEVQLEASLSAQLSAKVYGITGPSAEFAATARVYANSDAQWTLFGGLRAGIGAVFEIPLLVDVQKYVSLFTIEKQLASGGDQPPMEPCPFGDGLFCGESIGQTAGNLYACSGGTISLAEACESGCTVTPNGEDDYCQAGAQCPDGDGLYCGESVGLETGVLYQCVGGMFSQSQVCADGCVSAPAGENDYCANAPCDCNSGPCCDGCHYLSSATVCQADADQEYGCIGSGCGADVSLRYRDRHCSGFSEQCDGSFGAWGPEQVVEGCSTEESCTAGVPTCNVDAMCGSCTDTFSVTQYECSNYSFADGGGPGGGEIMEVCATTDPLTGAMIVKARKADNSTFGNRPYQVRVSGPGDDPCGPDTYFFEVSDASPTGIGSSELTFTFDSIWLPDQWEKGYCVTASTTPSDMGYQDIPQQSSWWYSEKTTLERQCN